MPIVNMKVPDPVEIRDPDTGAVIQIVSFKEFVQKAILRANPKWGFGYAAVRSAVAIEQAMDNIQGGAVTLSEEDWGALKQAVEAPRRIDRAGNISDGFGTWLHGVIPQFMPFLDAIMKAA
jgi:hypothetical protein